MSLGMCKCGAELKPLFTGTYCAAECDRPQVKPFPVKKTYVNEWCHNGITRLDYGGKIYAIFTGTPEIKTPGFWVKHGNKDSIHSGIKNFLTKNAPIKFESVYQNAEEMHNTAVWIAELP